MSSHLQLDGYALIHGAAAALQDETASAEERIKRAQAILRHSLTPAWVPSLRMSPTAFSFNHSLARRTGVQGITAVVIKPLLPAKGPLTPREHAVLQLIGRGLSNKRIARSMGISPETVKSHAKHILKKLNAQTRAEAVALASELPQVP